MLKRIKNELRVTHWPTIKKALKELGVVSFISLFIMFLVMFMDNIWMHLIVIFN